MTTEQPASRPRWRRWLIIALVLICLPLLLRAFLLRKPNIEAGSVLVVRLEGNLPEATFADPLRRLTQLMNPEEGPGSLHALRRALRHARTDGRIAGVMLELHPIAASWAAVEEVRDLLLELRAAGKPVVAFLAGDFIEEKEYSLAVAAGRLLANPEAGLLLNGLVAEVTFYRGVLDNLKIEPQALQFKAYKSAAEPVVNKEMSPAMREATTAIARDVFDRFVALCAERRRIDPTALRALFDRGLLTAKDALQQRLLDGTGYRDEVLTELLGGEPRRKDPRVLRVARYVRALAEEPQRGEVALIYALGPIISGSAGGGGFGSEVIEGERTARQLREAVEDDIVKAIVLRVDSPGGSAVGSDFIWREIARAKGKKPVVVSMSGVAGSGGYWISMGADAIVAQPSTLTGSIGVIALHMNVLPFLRWLGGNVDTVKLGAQADLMSPFRPWSAGQEALMKGWMGQVYDDFVAKVAKGRGLRVDQVEPIAGGRVWTGAQAKERHLVDELGGLTVALRLARTRAGLPASADAEPVVFPRARGWLGALSESAQVLTSTPPTLAQALRAHLLALDVMRPSVTAPTIDLH